MVARLDLVDGEEALVVEPGGRSVGGVYWEVDTLEIWLIGNGRRSGAELKALAESIF